MRLIFCIWIGTDRSNKLILKCQVGVVWHGWVSPKYFKMTYQQYLRNKSRYDVDSL